MLPGLKSMLNYHPLFVHFPIAFWFEALLFEALAIWRANDEWHRTAVRLLYLGTLAAFVTAFTGWLAESSVEPNPVIQHVFELHESLMLIATSFATALCIYCFAARDRFTTAKRRMLLLGLVVLAAVTIIGTDRGAQMVYQYAQSVNGPNAPK
ncbi:MAG TPA: DUF2231 domain-containing protein [Candidatus Limnocylindrales bacterium]|nr:DUF2231 domain-containing protein [Candidatus Limnocylindrales bacterium]